MKLLIRLLALVCSFAALSTSPALAEPELTRAESDFIGAVAPQGYSRDVYATVAAGHRVCALLDEGISTDGIERFVVDRFGDVRDSAKYYASLFGTYATYHLCPRHIGIFGNI